MKKFQSILVLIILVFGQLATNAQCAMCKATAESNPNVGGGLNAGIEYILVVPYILLGLFAFLVLKGKLVPFWKDLTGKDRGKTKEFTAKEWY